MNEDDHQSLLALACLLGLIIVIRFWQISVLTASIALVLWLLRKQSQRLDDRHLARRMDLANQRHRDTVVAVNGEFRLVQEIRLDRDQHGATIALVSTRLISDGTRIKTETREHKLWEARSGVPRHSINVLLIRHDIQSLGAAAVESSAMKTALQCSAELDWCEESQDKLQVMQAAAEATRQKAVGNPLLEESIPRLDRAIDCFDAERKKLKQTHETTALMLRQLFDFLSVPSTLRPILTVDLTSWDSEYRLQQLQSSFNDVLQLHDAYIELSQGLS